MAISHDRVGLGPFTYRDLEETPDDGHKYELSHGVLIVTPPPSLDHGRVHGRLVHYLADRRSPGQEVIIGPGLFIDETTVKEPDIAVVDRAEATGRYLRRPPALVVEVASPSTSRLDRTEKRLVYAEFGIRAYWLVDPARRSVTVLELVDGAYVEGAVPHDLLAAIFDDE
jgi:Uma2 family endonuclease